MGCCTEVDKGRRATGLGSCKGCWVSMMHRGISHDPSFRDLYKTNKDVLIYLKGRVGWGEERDEQD